MFDPDWVRGVLGDAAAPATDPRAQALGGEVRDNLLESAALVKAIGSLSDPDQNSPEAQEAVVRAGEALLAELADAETEGEADALALEAEANDSEMELEALKARRAQLEAALGRA